MVGGGGSILGGAKSSILCGCEVYHLSAWVIDPSLLSCTVRISDSMFYMLYTVM